MPVFIGKQAVSQITYAKDSVSATVGCSESQIVMSIIATNTGIFDLNYKWVIDVSSRPSTFGKITVCDPEICRDSNVYSSNFLFEKGKSGAFTVDVATNKKLGDVNFKLFVYNPSDSANSVKVLKYIGKSTCANAAIASPRMEKLFRIVDKNLIFKGHMDVLKIEIFNLMGQLVYSNLNHSSNYSLDGINEGAYILVAKTNEEDIMQKIIIE